MKKTASKKGQSKDPIYRVYGMIKHLGKTSDELMRELRGDPDAVGEPPSQRNMRAVVSEKGQVTIPKRLRDRMGIRPGQIVEWAENQGKLVGRKVSSADDDPIRRIYGILNMPGSTDEWIREIRGEPDAL